MFRVILLDHEKIGAAALQMMQFGSFDARVKRIKGALEEGKYWWEDLNVRAKPEIAEGWSDQATKLKERLIQAGDTVIDESGKVWMLDYTGWENVSKQLSKPLASEIKMMSATANGIDTIPKAGVVVKEQKDRKGDQERKMSGTQTNGVTTNASAAEEVVMLPPAELNDTEIDDSDDEDEGDAAAVVQATPAQKKRGRKPGSKNKPKEAISAKATGKKAAAKPAAKKASATTAAAKKASAKPAAKKASAKPAAKKASAKSTAAKPRKRGIVGVKAQTQVEKAAFSEILRRAKDQGLTSADIVRMAVYKYLGYKPEPA